MHTYQNRSPQRIRWAPPKGTTLCYPQTNSLLGPSRSTSQVKTEKIKIVIYKKVTATKYLIFNATLESNKLTILKEAIALDIIKIFFLPVLSIKNGVIVLPNSWQHPIITIAICDGIDDPALSNMAAEKKITAITPLQCWRTFKVITMNSDFLLLLIENNSIHSFWVFDPFISFPIFWNLSISCPLPKSSNTFFNSPSLPLNEDSRY